MGKRTISGVQFTVVAVNRIFHRIFTLERDKISIQEKSNVDRGNAKEVAGKMNDFRNLHRDDLLSCLLLAHPAINGNSELIASIIPRPTTMCCVSLTKMPLLSTFIRSVLDRR